MFSLFCLTSPVTVVIALNVFCCAWLTDGRDEIQEALFWEERVLQSSEIQLQHSCHWVNVMLILVVNQGIFTLFKKNIYAFSNGIWWAENKEYIKPSAFDSPLSNEFLISLTSTCDPGTRNMPCCCNPERNTTQNLQIQSYATHHYLQTPVPASWKPIGNT